MPLRLDECFGNNQIILQHNPDFISLLWALLDVFISSHVRVSCVKNIYFASFLPQDCFSCVGQPGHMGMVGAGRHSPIHFGTSFAYIDSKLCGKAGAKNALERRKLKSSPGKTWKFACHGREGIIPILLLEARPDMAGQVNGRKSYLHHVLLDDVAFH